STLWLPSQLSKWFGQLIWKLPHRLFLQVLTSVSKQKEWQVSLAQQVFHPYVLSNLMHLCREEMLFVKDLDLQCIQTYLPSLVFYYGVQDHWVPLDMWKNLKQTFPEGNYMFEVWFMIKKIHFLIHLKILLNFFFFFFFFLRVVSLTNGLT
ncbi:hypothetical protein HMI56_004623, partial [Coelomomyces lativittatus]